MKVQLLHIEECPGHKQAAARLAAGLAAVGLPDVPIEEVLVRTPEDAASMSFAGSPTMLVDGEDLFPTANSLLANLACRVYSTEAGLADSPSQAQIEDALRERLSPSA